jgi:hypothetical protein
VCSDAFHDKNGDFHSNMNDSKVTRSQVIFTILSFRDHSHLCYNFLIPPQNMYFLRHHIFSNFSIRFSSILLFLIQNRNFDNYESCSVDSYDAPDIDDEEDMYDRQEVSGVDWSGG